jgi:AcrR family transcriptional regulator
MNIAPTRKGQTVGRRESILDSALDTFTRFGYQKTSMDAVASAARISRPGLYFLFNSKEELFRATVSRALNEDLAAVERALGEDLPLPERLQEAFDHWAGRYVGPGARDLSTVIDTNPDLVGDDAEEAPRRFAELIRLALDASSARRPSDMAQVLIALSVGIKHQVATRAEYRELLAVGIELVVS